jgi:hypothetical protein
MKSNDALSIEPSGPATAADVADAARRALNRLVEERVSARLALHQTPTAVRFEQALACIDFVNLTTEGSSDDRYSTMRMVGSCNIAGQSSAVLPGFQSAWQADCCGELRQDKNCRLREGRPPSFSVKSSINDVMLQEDMPVQFWQTNCLSKQEEEWAWERRANQLIAERQSLLLGSNLAECIAKASLLSSSEGLDDYEDRVNQQMMGIFGSRF